MDFRHATSSPGYPQSNGLAEKTVQTAKNILSRAKAEGSDPCLALLEYCSIPVDNLAFPAQLLKGRQLRSILPPAAKHHRPMTVNSTEVLSRRQQAQTTLKMYHDCTAHQLPPLQPGDKIHVQLSKGDKWTPAQVIAPSSTPRSYQEQTDDGRTYRRNRLLMKPIHPHLSTHHHPDHSQHHRRHPHHRRLEPTSPDPAEL